LKRNTFAIKSAATSTISQMAAQYDSIQASYDEIRKASIALIELQNVQDIVAPFIKGASVLDLACGTGFYSFEFLKWGLV